MRLTTLLSAGVVMLIMLLPAAVRAQPAVRIGVAGPHTGDLAPYGIPTREAAELIVARVNAEGGVLGRSVELLPMDDQCKPEIATNVATRLVSQGVALVIGHVCSGATKAALGIYNEAGVLVISPSATTPTLTKSGDYPNFYRTIAPDDEQGKLAAEFVTERLGAKKVAIIHDKGDYGKGFADFAREFVTAGGSAEVVLYEGITPGAMDYSAVVQKLRRFNADAVIFGGYHPEASKLVAQMNRKRLKVPLIGPDGIKGEGFLEIAGVDAEGVYATGPKDVSGIAANRQARAEYIARHGKEPGTFFDQGYAAMQAALNAIEAAGSIDPAALARTLKSASVDTTLGRISFDAKGDAVGVGFAVYQVQNGRFVEM